MPDIIVERARAKVNLALHVLGRRADGYHELDSIVAFADVGDALTFERAQQTSLAITGPFAKEVPPGSDNLVMRAVSALAAQMDVPAMRITLEKNLPPESGIGGGSADAAATLRGVLRLSGAGIDPAVMEDAALSLGADVPICMKSQACRMGGIGEILAPVGTVPAPAIVLVNPLQGCSTAAVFASLGLKAGDRFGKSLDPADPSTWRNDLLEPAMRVAPAIAEVLSALRAEPAFSAVRMSGSGATCFGLAASRTEADRVAARLSARHPHWWVKAATLS